MNKDGVISLWPVIFAILTTSWPRPQLSQFYRYRATFTRMTLTGIKLIVPHFTIDGDLLCTNLAIQGSIQIPKHLNTLPWPQSPIYLANLSLYVSFWTLNLTISPRFYTPLIPHRVSITLNPIDSPQLIYSSMSLPEGNPAPIPHEDTTTNFFQPLIEALLTQERATAFRPFHLEPTQFTPRPTRAPYRFPILSDRSTRPYKRITHGNTTRKPHRSQPHAHMGHA
jgi:hypothetical protein